MPPEHDDEALSARLQASARILDAALTPAQSICLLDYLTLLGRWNKVYNLTAVRERSDMLTHHLLDSLAVVAPLRLHAQGRALRILDVGSGAGLPAVVLAALEPHWSVDSLDAVAKKVGFVRQVAAELRLGNLHALHSRVEALTKPVHDVIVCRAFASLADFVKGSRASLAPRGVWLAMKGKVPAEEIAALPPEVEMFHVERCVIPGLEADRCLIWLRPSPGALAAP